MNRKVNYALALVLCALCWASTAHARRYDAETGLMYFRNRMYSPELGRFVSRDPIGYRGGGLSLYNYVRNQPSRYSDPSGTKVSVTENLIWMLYPGEGKWTSVDWDFRKEILRHPSQAAEGSFVAEFGRFRKEGRQSPWSDDPKEKMYSPGVTSLRFSALIACNCNRNNGLYEAWLIFHRANTLFGTNVLAFAQGDGDPSSPQSKRGVLREEMTHVADLFDLYKRYDTQEFAAKGIGSLLDTNPIKYGNLRSCITGATAVLVDYESELISRGIQDQPPFMDPKSGQPTDEGLKAAAGLPWNLSTLP